MVSEFENKIALITGSSRGIGEGIALKMAEEGAGIVVNSRNSQQEALEVAKRIKSLGRKAAVIRADVSRRDEVGEMIERTMETFGRIDILVNNAGAVFEPAGWQEVSEENFAQTLAVNLTGAFNCIRAIAPIMIKHKKGKIVNIASLAGIEGGVNTPAYSAAKAGIINLTRAFAKELAPYVNVNAVAPSWVRTDWHRHKGRGFFKMVERVTPMKRIAEIEDVVNAVLFLVSDKANFITGQTLIIDGGLSLR